MPTRPPPVRQGHMRFVLACPRQPLDGEEREDWKLPSHKKLPEMCCGALIRLARSAKDSNLAQHYGKSGKRHGDGKKSARLSDDGAEGADRLIHYASLGGENVLTERRPANLSARAGGRGGPAKAPQIRAVADLSSARIHARLQAGQGRFHKGSNLFKPALATCASWRVWRVDRRGHSP